MDVQFLRFVFQDPTEPQSSQQTLKPPVTTDGDEFNSFQFWREPLASVDDSLLDLLVSLWVELRWRNLGM